MKLDLDRYRDLAPLALRLFVALVLVYGTQDIAPLSMLTGGIFFVLYGAPRYSLDAARQNRARSAGVGDHD